MARGVDLERGEMRGDDAEDSGVEEVLCDRDGERRAFVWVGRGAELVDEDKGAFIGTLDDAVEVADVRGEGGEVLLDGLRVADVGEDAGEDRQASGLGRDGNAGLGHDGQQADSLERDGFAAGVWAADDHLALARGKRDGHGDDAPGLCTHTQFE